MRLLKRFLLAIVLVLITVPHADAARVRRLNVPNPLVATVTLNKAALSWTDVANEYNYIIERRVKETTTFTQIGIVGSNVTKFIDTITTIGEYEYRVRASRNSIYSVYTNLVSVSYCG